MIEILVALAILGILIIPIGSMVSSIIDVNKSAQDNIKTAAIMNEMVEYASSVGFNKDALDNYAQSLEIKYPYYKFNYEVLQNESTNINGIVNNKSDVSLSIQNGTLNVQDKKDNIKSKNINLDKNMLNKIQIKAFYINTSTLKYLIKNETTNDEFSIETTNPDFGIDFDDMNMESNLNINICIDGIYDVSNELISNKFIIFRHRREESPGSITSQTPFIIISKMELNTSYENEESIIKTDITIKNNNGKIIREQVCYFTKRLK